MWHEHMETPNDFYGTDKDANSFVDGKFQFFFGFVFFFSDDNFSLKNVKVEVLRCTLCFVYDLFSYGFHMTRERPVDPFPDVWATA